VMGLPPTYAEITGLGYTMGKGFDGMAVAMVGRNHPIGILFSALFFGGLTAGGRAMQGVGVPLEMVRVVEGIIVVAMAIPGLVRLLRPVRARLTGLLRREAS
ncbi:MAG: ABC transporter permease, partial [Candidatus Bipolaricaulota bacterium]